MAGAAYRVFSSYEAFPSYQRIPEVAYDMIGPLASVSSVEYHSNGLISFEGVRIVDVNGVRATKSGTAYFNTGTVQHRNFQARIERTDGGTDPPAVPEQPAVYAPNRARNPGVDLAPPTPIPTAAPSPWPNRPTPPAPGQQPFPYIPTGPSPMPRPDVPDEYVNNPDRPGLPTSPFPIPGAGTGTGIGAGAAPSSLGTGVGTGTQSAPSRGGPLQNGSGVTVFRPVSVPGNSRPGPRTPVLNLTPPLLRPTPDVVKVPVPVPQARPEPPNKLCLYERQRVADIQAKATETRERAANPVSGFPGLYGLQIEARAKLGQTFDNTEETKKRIRPEDFPIVVPAQIANPNTGMRTIESLGELGVWIVEQLDGVSGKWPMEVPIPGVSQTLAVPNISEAIAEMFGMMISQQVTAAQILNTSSRTLAQAGSATQQAALANMIAKGNAEFLGYESRPTAVDMPLTYSPGKDPGEGLLEESTAKIRGWENTDGTDLKQILSDLMHAAQIIKAVYWRKLDAKGDFQQQINDQIRGKSDWLDELGKRPSPQQASDWEEYLKQTESGFSGLSKDETPYGRTTDEGPKIKDLTPNPDAPDTTP